MSIFRDINLKKIIKNSSAQLIVRTTTAASTLLTIFLITYLQGFQFLGSITKVIAYVSLFYTVVDFGFNAIYIKRGFNVIHKNIHNLIALRVIVSLTTIIIAILVSFLLPHNPNTGSGFSQQDKLGIVIFSATMLTFSISLSLQAILQKTLNYHKAIIPSIFSSLVLISAVVIGTYSQNILLIFASYVLSATLFIILLSRKILPKNKIKIQVSGFFKFAKNMIKASAPLAIVLILSLIHTKSDLFILALIQPSKDVGIYGFSYRIFDFLLTIPAFLTASMYPLLLKAKSSSTFPQLIKKYSAFLLIVAVFITSITIVLSPFLALLRQDFAHSILPLQVLVVSLPLFFLTSLFQWILVIANKLKALTLVYAAATIINISLNMLLIPKYSYLAAAITTSVSEMITLVLLVLILVIYKTKIFQNAK